MVNIDKVRIGQIFMTDEYLAGEYRVLCGAVVLVDRESNLVVIEVEGERRSFPPGRLYTPNAFMSRKIDPPRTVVSNREVRVLAGLLMTVKAGRVAQSDLQAIYQEIEKKGIRPARPQDALEVVTSL